MSSNQFDSLDDELLIASSALVSPASLRRIASGRYMLLSVSTNTMMGIFGALAAPAGAGAGELAAAESPAGLLSSRCSHARLRCQCAPGSCSRRAGRTRAGSDRDAATQIRRPRRPAGLPHERGRRSLLRWPCAAPVRPSQRRWLCAAPVGHCVRLIDQRSLSNAGLAGTRHPSAYTNARRRTLPYRTTHGDSPFTPADARYLSRLARALSARRIAEQSIADHDARPRLPLMSLGP